MQNAWHTRTHFNNQIIVCVCARHWTGFFDQIFHILTQFLMQTRKKLFKGSSNHPIIVYTHTCIQMMRKIEVDVPQTATNVRDEYTSNGN